MIENPPEHIGYDLIADEIEDRSRVLDLGCGTGSLLDMLRRIKKIDGYGVEISSEGASACVEKGLYCYQGDIDEGLSDYKNNSFDYVILNQTLQNTKKPEYVLREIMRICRYCIISFPNFGNINIRLQLLSRGRMPKNRLLPYEWYESPNIHLLTIMDFRDYCRARGYPIRKERHFSINRRGRHKLVNILPGLFAQYGFFILDGESFTGNNGPVSMTGG